MVYRKNSYSVQKVKHDPSNCRGISILTAMSKVYDSILNNRLTLWFKPDPEQALRDTGILLGKPYGLLNTAWA